jgi:hypothetical protein
MKRGLFVFTQPRSIADTRTLRWLPEKGWLPLSFALDRHPYRIRWAEFGSMPLEQPFYDWSVVQLRGAHGKREEWETDLRTLLEMAQLFPSTRPAGVIAHVSRCGSTWISNCLKTAENVTVVSEAPPVNQVLDPAFAPQEAQYPEAVRQQMLSSLVTTFSRYRGGEPTHVVLKLAFYGLFAISRLRSYWPDLPILILIRNPVEVIASNVFRPPGWLVTRDLSGKERAFDWVPKNPWAMTDEEYAARAIGSLCQSALQQFDRGCMVVDYENMNDAAMERIASFFGLHLPAAQDPAFRTMMSADAKDRTNKGKFVKAKAEHDLTSISEAAEKWALEPYLRLRALQQLRPE